MFKPRRVESDVKGFFDTPEGAHEMFEKDCKHIFKKEKLCQLLVKEDKQWGLGRDLNSLVTDLKNVFMESFCQIVSMISFYASVGTGGDFTMQLNEYSLLLQVSSPIHFSVFDLYTGVHIS